MKSKDLTILFLSCDKYSDLWEPLLFCFRKYWPDCPYPVYLGSNTIKDSKFPTLLSGRDRDWSSSLRAILKQIHTQYVFIWLDDIFPTHTVKTGDFAAALDYIENNRAKHMHILPQPAPDRLTRDSRYGLYERGAPYRATVLGFWDVTYLTGLLIGGESPWNFEVMGSYRTSYDDGFYCSMKKLFDWLHVVEKGKVFPEAYAYCKTHGISLNAVKREVVSGSAGLKSALQKHYFNSIIHIPWTLRLSTMNILRKLFISY